MGGRGNLAPFSSMQLDFIGNIYNNSFIQGDLFDAPVARKPFTKDVEEFFHSVSNNEIEEHQNYWDRLTPEEPEQKFQRYLFAFLSVHTSWENNVKAYIRIKDFWNWMGNDEELRSRLIECGVGLHNNRVRFISAFSKDYWQNRKSEYEKKSETWTEYRDRLESRILGLGLAKTSFALEMQHPLEAHCFCADTHLFQLYKLHQQKHIKLYKEIENHWLIWSKMFNIPSYIARAIFWNRKQKQKNCHYWAYCL